MPVNASLIVLIGEAVVVLHLGDHDPSGIDMTRDNENRLRMFIGADVNDQCFRIKRLALNMDRICRYNPPPNPAKMTDSPFEDYMATHGNKLWELDALDPTVIGNLIERELLMLRDDDFWDQDNAKENSTAINFVI